MIEECGVHGLAYLIITTEAERQVADTTTGLGQRQVLLDPFDSTDEVDGIGLMFFQTCAYGKNVNVEDDVLWWEVNSCQQVVGALGNGYFPFVSRRLTLLIEGHHYHGSS